jgi:predicted phosphodiesterase
MQFSVRSARVGAEAPWWAPASFCLLGLEGVEASALSSAFTRSGGRIDGPLSNRRSNRRWGSPSTAANRLMAPAGDIMRTLLIADVHANLAALQALPVADTIICAGDLVGFGSDPDSVIDWLRARSAICVRGDEDDAIAFGRQHVLPPGFEFAARETRRWTALTISPSSHAFLRSLAPEIERTVDQVHIAVIHAYPGDYDLYVDPRRSNSRGWHVHFRTPI